MFYTIRIELFNLYRKCVLASLENKPSRPVPAKFRPLNGSISELARVRTFAHAAGATSTGIQSVVMRISALPQRHKPISFYLSTPSRFERRAG